MERNVRETRRAKEDGRLERVTGTGPQTQHTYSDRPGEPCELRSTAATEMETTGRVQEVTLI